MQKNFGTLHATTIKLLKDCKYTHLQLHEETGLSYHWITKFATGVIVDPSVNKVQKLYEFLSGEKIV